MSGWLNGVLVAWQVGLFGSLVYLLGVWLVGARCVVFAPRGVWCCMPLYALLCHVCGYPCKYCDSKGGGGGVIGIYSFCSSGR